MGTSSSYGGPTNINPLLPPWAPAPSDPEHSDETQDQGDNGETPESATLWAKPKGAMTRLSRTEGGANGIAIGRIGRGFVGALGGGRAASRSSMAGRRAARNLGRFLSSAASVGVAETERLFGLQEFIGAGAELLLARLVDTLSPDGALVEDAIARSAMIDTLSELFDQYSVDENSIEALYELNSEQIVRVLERYFSNYIYTRLMQTLGDRLDRNASTPLNVRQIESDIKEYVFQTVRLELGEIDLLNLDWNSDDGQDLIDRIFEMGYEVMEAGM